MLGTQVMQNGTGILTGRPQTGTPPTAGPDVDRDVTAAVEQVLGRYVRERVHHASRVDAQFAADVAEQLAQFVIRGGKRLRASFLWWGWRAAGGTTDGEEADAALRLGAAIELIQGCALVHDDVMDESPVRRGAPAVHAAFAQAHTTRGMRGSSAAFGTAAAILAGDLALSWADDLMTCTALTSPQGSRVHREWQAMRTELVAGQYLDMHAQATGSTSVVEAVRIAGLKSALYTVERPLALGAALAGADERTTDALRSAGRCAGIAFQLRDDLVGAFGDPASTGKPSGDDLREGKATYLRAVAVRLAATGGVTDITDGLNPGGEGRSLTDDEVDRLRQAIESTGAPAVVEEKIDRLVELSVRHLASLDSEPYIVGELTRLVGRAAGVQPNRTGEPA
ncbi:polyprenyl synthetase family protein [Streptomyces sp. NPDC051098]|uniref:polyprenyl synthetase family protein n=1 Tax=Streptomyces sp. NPDC051098 TaxID=3155411 RepID=UPI003433BB7C